MLKNFTFLLILISLISFFSCQKKETNTLFTQLSPGETGINFANHITPDDTLNILYFMYMYNGAGVGIGDFNGDSLPDIFFSGNQVSSKFYLNKGNFKFEDMTEKAGLKTDRWATGVSVADVNADGLLDIYVCVAHNNLWNKSNENLLFVNQGVKDGIPTFKEMAKEYNLADTSYSTQAAFFDYDRDGDLDMYLLNNWLEKESHNRLRPQMQTNYIEMKDLAPLDTLFSKIFPKKQALSLTVTVWA
ncbi:MAG: VCBS repeat-containing protein [Cytophagales bacterium]|nr:MAG: VCBS repeat-containing protein [Cytophagales bacterium]